MLMFMIRELLTMQNQHVRQLRERFMRNSEAKMDLLFKFKCDDVKGFSLEIILGGIFYLANIFLIFEKSYFSGLKLLLVPMYTVTAGPLKNRSSYKQREIGMNF